MFYATLWLTSLLILLAILFSFPPWRRALLIKPLLAHLKRTIPPLSDTDSIALQAGDVWWEKELFCGHPDWQALHNMPLSQLTPNEQAFIEGPVEILCALLDDYKIFSEYHNLPPIVWDYLKENKFFGLVIPEIYGGLGFSALAHSNIILKI